MQGKRQKQRETKAVTGTDGGFCGLGWTHLGNLLCPDRALTTSIKKPAVMRQKLRVSGHD